MAADLSPAARVPALSILLGAGSTDHPARAAIDAEFHSRPSVAVEGPARIEHLALWVRRAGEDGQDGWGAVFEGLARLSDAANAPRPEPGQRHGLVALGAASLKWERHTEFLSLSIVRPETPDPDTAQRLAALAPALRSVPGERIVALEIEVSGRKESLPSTDELAARFGTRHLAGALILERGFVATDFRIGPEGVTRMHLVDCGLPAAQLGRIAQRLIELETYRMIAMLGLPLAQEATPVIDRLEIRLRSITADLKAVEASVGDDALLDRLTGITIEAEELSNRTAFRLSATQAYAAIVETRLAELHQSPVPGLPRLTTFLERRFSPAMATCRSVERRQGQLAERIARTGSLLRTRVDIALELQNQNILTSLDKNARTQIRLQQTVEGLSVVAISYYAVGLIGYAMSGVEGLGHGLSAKVLTGLTVPLVVLLVILVLRRLGAPMRLGALFGLGGRGDAKGGR
ncbi:MAG: DUF3422 domain-containing protein [Alphaproteobacteria bacterium]|nr:DUF3422 domain-containing protein [Alphaproteobacteria bacterium]